MRAPKDYYSYSFAPLTGDPICKVQLVQLQRAQARFSQHGLRVAALTYNNAAILQELLLPTEVPVTWELRIHPWENTRASERLGDIK